MEIQRRASSVEIQPLKQIYPQEYLLDASRKPISPNQELQITESFQVENKLVKYLQDLQNQKKIVWPKGLRHWPAFYTESVTSLNESIE